MALSAPNENKHLELIDKKTVEAYKFNDKSAVDAATESIKNKLMFENYFFFTQSYLFIGENRVNISFGIFGKVFIINKLF